VQLTADGEAMVFHDFVLERLTEASGKVEAMKAQAVAAVAMKGTGDRIPTLAAFIESIAGKVPLIVEIKSRFDGDLRLTQRTAEIVARNPGHPIALKSFDPVIVTALRELTPERPRGIVAMSAYSDTDFAHLSQDERYGLANLLHYPESQPDFLSWRVRDLPSGLPMLWRKALARPVMTWTVRSEKDRDLATRHGDQMVFEGFRP
jgi:glycerophosphoryl diester phosphodiesterase